MIRFAFLTREIAGLESSYDETDLHMIFFFAAVVTECSTVGISAKVAELADAPDLGSGTERCGGSSPPFRTKRLYFELRALFFVAHFVYEAGYQTQPGEIKVQSKRKIKTNK